MVRKIPVLELKNPTNWSRVHPLIALFFIALIILIIGIATSGLHFLIIPALVILILYLVFFWKFIEELF